MQHARFIIYARSYCHLCDEMREALQSAFRLSSRQIQMVDVDADPELDSRYDELVPVLMGYQPDGTLTRLCHHFLDPVAVQTFLRQHG